MAAASRSPQDAARVEVVDELVDGGDVVEDVVDDELVDDEVGELAVPAVVLPVVPGPGEPPVQAASVVAATTSAATPTARRGGRGWAVTGWNLPAERAPGETRAPHWASARSWCRSAFTASSSLPPRRRTARAKARAASSS